MLFGDLSEATQKVVSIRDVHIHNLIYANTIDQHRNL